MGNGDTGAGDNGGGAMRRIVLVTGVSGAGRSTALKALEDIGFEAVDNLPLSLLENVAQGPTADARPLAIGIDVRSRDFAAESLSAGLGRLLAAGKADITTLFLDCEDDVLVRRYTETRRRHPLAADRPIADGLRVERRMLEPLRQRADQVIDTSQLPPGALKEMLAQRYALDRNVGLAVLITSFSYRFGIPREADLVFDVRFLANPHYDPALRALTGRDGAVGDYIAADADFGRFMDGLKTMLMILLPRYEREGKSYLTIAVGCTGGRHRSVFAAERLTGILAAEGWRVHLSHRDIQRESG